MHDAEVFRYPDTTRNNQGFCKSGVDFPEVGKYIFPFSEQIQLLNIAVKTTRHL